MILYNQIIGNLWEACSYIIEGVPYNAVGYVTRSDSIVTPQLG